MQQSRNSVATAERLRALVTAQRWREAAALIERGAGPDAASAPLASSSRPAGRATLPLVTSGPVVLVDTPPAGDRRASHVLAGYRDASVVSLEERRAAGGLWSGAAALWLLLRGLLAGLALAPRLRPLLKGYPRQPVFAGLGAAWRWSRAAVAAGPALRGASLLHAHDLYCAVAAWRAAPRGARLIYDSHEVQFHRRRRTGALRILIEAGLEHLVLKRCDELRTVSEAIAALMRLVHGPLPPVTVAYNDFYRQHPVEVPDAARPVVLVYTGRGLRGRLLEQLDRPPEALGAELHLYSLGEPLPPTLSGAHWQQGPADYEAHLLALVRDRRCLMWCCSDQSCLSYSYALPNKFFQALAVGIPVIASEGSWLAGVVRRHGLGAVLEGQSLEAVLAAARGPQFAAWCANIAALRAQLRDGRVRL